MKKYTRIYSYILAAAAATIMASCAKDDTPTGMDASLVVPSRIIGKWENNDKKTDFRRYTNTKADESQFANDYKNGAAWYEGEDVQENDEGTKFYWKIDGNVIIEKYQNMETWLERRNTLMKLTDSELEFFDNGYTKHYYHKVN